MFSLQFWQLMLNVSVSSVTCKSFAAAHVILHLLAPSFSIKGVIKVIALLEKKEVLISTFSTTVLDSLALSFLCPLH